MKKETETLEIEADSLSSDREEAKARTPVGLHILSEEIIYDGKRKTVKGIADTVEAAFANALDMVPPDA